MKCKTTNIEVKEKKSNYIEIKRVVINGRDTLYNIHVHYIQIPLNITMHGGIN